MVFWYSISMLWRSWKESDFLQQNWTQFSQVTNSHTVLSNASRQCLNKQGLHASVCGKQLLSIFVKNTNCFLITFSLRNLFSNNVLHNLIWTQHLHVSRIASGFFYYLFWSYVALLLLFAVSIPKRTGNV